MGLQSQTRLITCILTSCREAYLEPSGATLGKMQDVHVLGVSEEKTIQMLLAYTDKDINDPGNQGGLPGGGSA